MAAILKYFGDFGELSLLNSDKISAIGFQKKKKKTFVGDASGGYIPCPAQANLDWDEKRVLCQNSNHFERRSEAKLTLAFEFTPAYESLKIARVRIFNPM